MSIGFAQERQFQLNPTNSDFGNRVTLVSATLSVPCDVERDSTHSGQIMCYTRYVCTETEHGITPVSLIKTPSKTRSQLKVSKVSGTIFKEGQVLRKGTDAQKCQVHVHLWALLSLQISIL